MKFLIVKNIHEDPNFKPILFGLLIFIFFYLLIDLFVKQEGFGITPVDVFSTLFGNEDEYLDPIDKSVFLEFWHMEIFLTMLLLFTLNSIFIRLSLASKLALYLSHTMMISAFSALVSLAISFFFLADFVYLYSMSFMLWHILALYATAYSLFKLYA